MTQFIYIYSCVKINRLHKNALFKNSNKGTNEKGVRDLSLEPKCSYCGLAVMSLSTVTHQLVKRRNYLPIYAINGNL